MNYNFDTIWKKYSHVPLRIENLARRYNGRPLFTVQIPIRDKKLLNFINSFKIVLGTNAIEWHPPEQLHITLKIIGFLGKKRTREQVTRKELNNYAKKLRLLLKRKCFQLKFGPINRFPNTLFLEISNANQLYQLHKILAKNMRTKFEFEGRQYLPHLTIGRFVRDSSLVIRKLPKLRNTRKYSVKIKRIVIAQSFFKGRKKSKKVIAKYALM